MHSPLAIADLLVPNTYLTVLYTVLIYLGITKLIIRLILADSQQIATGRVAVDGTASLQQGLQLQGLWCLSILFSIGLAAAMVPGLA